MTDPRKPADPIVSGGPSKPRAPRPAAKKAAPKKTAAPTAALAEAPTPEAVAAPQAEPVMKTMPPPPVLTADQRAAALKAQRKRNIAIGLGLVGFIVIVYLVTVLRMGGAIASRPL